jgi:hypothetical protein
MTMTRQDRNGRPALLLAAVLLAAPLGGCISVKTPEKPIEINLNVNIQQEVLVRLQRDVDQLIRDNPDAFPQGTQQPATPRPSTQ